MASSKEYLEFVLEQLAELDKIPYRAMMGEYIIYYRGKIVGGIYDDRLLVKPIKSAISNHGFDVAGEVGEPFNPDVHDAVSYEERDDMEPGLVSTLHQRGYRLKDRLLRPAKVSVSRKPA